MYIIVLSPNLKRTYDQIDQIEKQIRYFLSKIGYIPMINKWFLIHTREWERRGHLGLDQANYVYIQVLQYWNQVMDLAFTLPWIKEITATACLSPTNLPTYLPLPSFSYCATLLL